MRKRLSDPWVLIVSLLVLLLTGWLAYTQQATLLLVPGGLLSFYLLLQYPVALFYLLMVSIPWSLEYSFPNGLGTDLPDEPLMLLAAFAALLLLVNRWKETRSFLRHPLVLLLFIQWTWVLATALVATDTTIALKQVLARSWYLWAFVALPVQLWKEERVMRRSLILLFVSMMVAMLLAVLRHAMLGFRFEGINTALDPFFRNHVNYSALLVAMVPVNVVLWQQAGTPARRRAWGVLMCVVLTALYFSYARGAWLALFAGAFTFVLVQRKALVPSFMVVVCCCLAAAWWLQRDERYLDFAPDYNHTVYHNDFQEHLVATYQGKDLSTAERFYRWVAGARLAADHWKTGTGPGTFYRNYKPYAIPAYKTWVSRNEERSTVHNYFLLTLIEQGIPGLVLLLALWFVLLYYAQSLYHRLKERFWKRLVMGVAVVLVMVAIVNFLSDLIETDKVGPLFYMCAALLIIVDFRAKNLDAPPHIQGVAQPVPE